MTSQRHGLIGSAVNRLTNACGLLGDAADDLRGLGFPDALNAIGEAKDAINDAKNKIKENE